MSLDQYVNEYLFIWGFIHNLQILEATLMTFTGERIHRLLYIT